MAEPLIVKQLDAVQMKIEAEGKLTINSKMLPEVAKWQTDVNLAGTDGNTSFPSGNGDLVMLVTATTSDVAVGLTIGYRTHA